MRILHSRFILIAQFILSAPTVEFGRRWFFTDSSAVLGMLGGESASLQEFAGTRTSEVKSKSDPLM